MTKNTAPTAAALATALIDVLDGLGALTAPHTLEGWGIPADRAAEIVSLVWDGRLFVETAECPELVLLTEQGRRRMTDPPPAGTVMLVAAHTDGAPHLRHVLDTRYSLPEWGWQIWTLGEGDWTPLPPALYAAPQPR